MKSHRGSLLMVWIVFCSCLGRVLPQSRCPAGFITEPPEDVIVPEGGGLSVICEHTSAGINWYREGTLLQPSTEPRDECDCIIAPQQLVQREGEQVVRINLTFINFRADRVGGFGCWRSLQIGFDQCPFDVAVAEPPTVILNQNHISGASLGSSTMTISPVVTLGLPIADLRWEHNGQVLDPDTNDRVTIDEGTGRLSITGVEAGDRGQYRFNATNSAVTVSRTVDVRLDFMEVTSLTAVLQGNNYVITCLASGYPRPISITWNPAGSPPSTRSVPGSFETNVTSVYTFPRSECTDVNQNYFCNAESASGRTAVEGVTPCDAPDAPTMVEVDVLGPTEVEVSWNEVLPPAIGYRIRYSQVGSSAVTISDFIPITETSYIVRGLTPDTTVEFQVGSVTTDAEAVSPTYSVMIVQATLPDCDSPELTLGVNEVNAELISLDRQRTITLSWMPSEEGVTGYELTITPSPVDSTSSLVRILTQETEYTLPADSCNGRTYNFTVVPLNRCNSPGPRQTVSRFCSVAHGNPVTVDITSRGPTSLGLSVAVQGQDNMERLSRLLINATTLRIVEEEGKVLTNKYETSNFDLDSVCIGGLMTGTFYNICVTTELVGGGIGGQGCMQDSTLANDASGADLERCLEPDTIPGEQIMDASDFPDWAIAVIVVGALAVVAFIFCFIGLCFACNTSNSKDYDVGSVSSLQTASIPPGPGVPSYLPNHRNNSPQRSCLSYNKNGHRLNWNEHRDTLRQMDTDSGTHV